MEAPGIGVLQFPTFEEHNRDVDATIPSGRNPRPHPVKIIRVESGQVELGFAVSRQAGAAADPRVRLTKFDGPRRLIVSPLRSFPSPQTEEIVMVRYQEIQIGVEIENRRRILAFRGDQSVSIVLEIPPGMRTRQVDGLARSVGKKPWIGVQNAEWPFGHRR